MKKIIFLIQSLVYLSLICSGQENDTRVFTIFTSGGCGCTGSGGAPGNFTTHEEVLYELRQACKGIDFIDWDGTYKEAYSELNNNKDSYDGVLIIGRISGDYRLAFTGLPTIVVYNLFEFMDAQPYHLFATGKMDKNSVLKGGKDYGETRILTAQLDRRNLCQPPVTKAMFDDLVYKINLIKTVKELRETRILMVKNSKNEIIGHVNYRGDINQSFLQDHNEQYLNNFKQLFGIDIIPVELEEFYDTYQKTDIKEAEKIAEKWIEGARAVEASKGEIIKTARGYLALETLREKHNCTAVTTHVRSVTDSGELADRYNPGLGLELGFKTRGIQAVCQNYPDIVLSQVLAYLLTGRPSMLGDIIYDAQNSLEISLHCGIPVNPYGDERIMPYTIRTHAESPLRDRPEEPGSSTGITAEWPVGEPVTFWEIHSLNKLIRLNTGELVDGHAIYSGSEDLDNVMCTAKIVAKVDDIEKLQKDFQPYLYGIHTSVTLGDLRKQLKDIGVLLGLEIVESDR